MLQAVFFVQFQYVRAVRCIFNSPDEEGVISQADYTYLCVCVPGEGPRSRCYGRTAALRLIVQPCDEDDYFFLVPSS
jgi:hypothetical protein